MSRKQDAFYFDSFIACAELSCQAAYMLEKTISHFVPEDLRERLDEIHKIEHRADEKKHLVQDELVKAFITPVEREDILLLIQNLDEVTDHVEDVMFRIYYNNIQVITEETRRMARLVTQCCEAVLELMKEFADFKHSKNLREKVIRINTMEEAADALFVDSMRTLHTTCKDPVTIITQRDVYFRLEKCTDDCEHVADVIESILMKNS
ncbi:MAG: DUF47 family protein [Clostridiales bacterium]|nr:DUF47 family protein [Clostridiales bacterium]